MTRSYFKKSILTGATLVLICFSSVAFAGKIFSVAKWERTEITLKSSATYTNALQEAEVRALFVSPLGETNRVYGFWDGGKTWKIRFKPTFPGRWKYFTMCSDTANGGLHGQSGEFDCTAAKSDSRFAQHGPLQVARDQKHLEHADRTPFLWLGDTAWLAATKSTATEWQSYSETRASQKFNVTTWRLQPSKPDTKNAAFNLQSNVKANLEKAREIDAKIQTANRAGLLNAIAPLWEIGDTASKPLSEDQTIVLMRYAVARWGADDVAWVIAFECDNTGAQAARWQRIGRAVFNVVTHAPVVLLPGESVWALDGFRQERWATIFGLQTTSASDEASLPWLLNGPIATERKKTPLRPIITINPPTEVETPNALSHSINSDLSRRLMWWGLMLNTPAGVNYAAKDVAEWNTSTSADAETQPWRKAMALPGATSVGTAADFFVGKDFWRLESSGQLLATQPGFNSPLTHVSVARTDDQGMTLVYTPQERAVSIRIETNRIAGKTVWFNPRTGDTRAAIGTGDNANQRFETPSAGDWLLVISANAENQNKQLAARPKKTSGEIDKRR